MSHDKADSCDDLSVARSKSASPKPTQLGTLRTSSSPRPRSIASRGPNLSFAFAYDLLCTLLSTSYLLCLTPHHPQVETTGVAELTNISRFGEGLADKVANPTTLLQFYRRKKVERKAKNDLDHPEIDLDDFEGDADASGAKSKARMADLVKEYLQAQSLSVLPEMGFEEALESFIEKGSKTAIKEYVPSVGSL